jgi:hypothetical protein
MIIDLAYSFLRRMDYVDAHAFFSTTYLGRSARYYDFLRCSGAEPSVPVLLNLAGRLRTISNVELSASRSAEAGALAHKCMVMAVGRSRR